MPESVDKKDILCFGCCRYGKWDGVRCGHCGYNVKIAESNPRLLKQINYFRRAHLYRPEELYRSKTMIPDEPGVYGWYFDHHFGTVDEQASGASFTHQPIIVEGRNSLEKWQLMYIGIAGSIEGRTLRNRISDEHLRQNSKGSTLRQTLAALLYDTIGLDPRNQLNSADEKSILNNWIFEHGRVAWLTATNPEEIEKAILAEYGQLLPLNIEGNDHNPFRDRLRQLRKEWRDLG